ncbi:MAG: SusC/RagA family TonB-linked outer membrane protein [Bacteroidales bacterium]|nr:SusC/RagA family TonB-linked outer membrane protein [Bacteroidales bacterium]
MNRPPCKNKHERSGGSEQADYRFSLGYFTQDGTLRGSSFERYTLGLKTNYKLSKRIELGTNFNLANSIHHGNIDNWIFNTWFSPISQTLQMHPIVTPYDEDGQWNRSPLSNVRNPLVQIDNSNNTRPNYRAFGHLSLGIELLKGLKFKTMFGGNLSFNHNRELIPVFDYAPDFQNLTSSLTRYNDRYYDWNWQHVLTFEKNFGQHDFSLMGGFESSYSLYEWTQGTRYNLINESPEMQYFNASLENETIKLEGSGEDVASFSYFGRINYSYKGKYLFTSSLRQDASSKFGPDYRNGIFPSFSLGWKFSEEEFAKNIGFLSFGKIRGGWGTSGNSNIRPYSYYSTIVTTSVFGYGINNQDIPAIGAAPNGITNRELHWEALEGSNIGIDLAFFQNKFSLTADYFVKKNKGMLIEKPVPSIAGSYQQAPAYEGGSAALLANLGNVKNEGFEVSMGMKTNSGNFNHNFNLNFTYVVNVVGNIGGDTILGGPEAISENLNFTAENEPMGSFYGYVTDGLFRPGDAEIINGELVVTNQPFIINSNGEKQYAQPRAQPGDLKFKDLNNDGRITANDRGIIGNPHPKLMLGFTYNMNYKSWDLQLFFQGAFGHQIYNYSKIWLYNSSGRYNWAADATDRYRTPVYDENNNLIDPGNTTSDQFRFDIRNANNNYRISDYYVEDGDYIRLKNIQLGYTVPEGLTQRVGLASARFYLGIKDLLTFTKYNGFDPEILSGSDPLVAGVDFGSYPRPIIYTLGTNIRF